MDKIRVNYLREPVVQKVTEDKTLCPDCKTELVEWADNNTCVCGRWWYVDSFGMNSTAPNPNAGWHFKSKEEIAMENKEYRRQQYETLKEEFAPTKSGEKS